MGFVIWFKILFSRKVHFVSVDHSCGKDKTVTVRGYVDSGVIHITGSDEL